jgi:hypothetical protein
MSIGAILLTLSIAIGVTAWVARPLLQSSRQRRADIESWVAQLRKDRVDSGPAPAGGNAFCTQCGRQVREGDRYCSGCGAPLDEVAS